MDKMSEITFQEEYKPRLKLLHSTSNLLANRKIRKLISPIGIIILWEIISRSGHVALYILPTPSTIGYTLFHLLISGELLPHIYISLIRSLIGFALGSILGIILGIGIGWSKFVEDIVDVPVQLLRAVPKSALIPLIIIWLGLGETSKIFMVALPPFFLTLINTISGVKGVDLIMIKAARSLGASDRKILKEIVIPSAGPIIFAGLRNGIVVSMVLLVIAEMIAADRGLGYFILETQCFWLTERMFAGIMIISFIGFAFDWTVLFAEKKIIKWHRGKTIETV
ncbi:MAG: ABC transporter permease [Syntrophobacteraceae bacterium CG23_combo_of_CG06-09_8_20_14_all_50_8]|nr:MAG: ABC transporter permease [Syntrophobacteraceae bacterium CG23_combo_of_CG06-09_8_20_14_all_50_8]